jgi:hypothetical protein
MAKTKAPVDHEHDQVVNLLRELASNQNRSFTQEEIGGRIGVDPYNIIRRAAKYERALKGFAERVIQKHECSFNDWHGQYVVVVKPVLVWRLDITRCGQKRSAIMREFKAQ